MMGLGLALGSLLTLVPYSSLGRDKRAKVDPALVKREEMVTMSRHLGVTCAYCHDTHNFLDTKMPAYKKALEHIRLVDLLKKNGFKGASEATCYMCHRGKVIPDFKE